MNEVPANIEQEVIPENAEKLKANLPNGEVDVNSIDLTLEEYEQKLRKNINEALELVNELCAQSTSQIDKRTEYDTEIAPRTQMEFAEG